MAMPEATPALIERVEPYWLIEQTSADRVPDRGRTAPVPPGRTPARTARAARPTRAAPAPGRLSMPTSGSSCRRGPRHEVLDGRVVAHVLVAVGDHGAPPVPAAPPDDVHLGGQEGVGVAHDRADVHVVLPVLDGHVERDGGGASRSATMAVVATSSGSGRPRCAGRRRASSSGSRRGSSGQGRDGDRRRRLVGLGGSREWERRVRRRRSSVLPRARRSPGQPRSVW